MTENKTPSRRRSTKAANEQEPTAPAAPEDNTITGPEKTPDVAVVEEHTGPAQPEEVRPYVPEIGAFVQTEHFNLNVSAHEGGAPLLNVARKGWVGPAQLVVHANLIDDLIEGLTKLRNWSTEDSTEA